VTLVIPTRCPRRCLVPGQFSFTARVCMDAKDTNRGKGCSGNVCHGGHTPFAALAHTDRRVLATNNPPLLLKRSSFLADWLRSRPVWLPLRSKLKFRKA